MKNNHTPAPWHVAKMGNDSQGLVISEDGDNVAVTYYADDAAIIAAAPALLAALQQLEGMCNMPQVRQAMMKHEQAFYHKCMNAARVAIREAEGK